MTCHRHQFDSSPSDRPPYAPEILGRNGRRAVGWIEVAGDRADARDQARLCQPADRAARRLRRGRQFHHRQFQGSDEGRHQDRQRDRAGRGHRQGQPVQSEPRRRGRQGADRPGQDRPDAGRLDAGDDQPGLDPVRDRGGAVHLDRGAVAALVHRPAGQSRRRAAGWKGFNYTYHFFWGLEDVIAVFTNMWSQVATNKSVGGLFPNDGDGNAWGDKDVGFPPVLDKGGYKLTDPGRYQNLTDNFSAADRRVQDRPIARSSPAWCSRRISRRSGSRRCSRASSPRSPRSARRSCSRSRSRRWARTATTCRRRCGGRPAIRSSRR